MNILAKVIYGSKMYQLDNPDSDTDVKIIALPDLKDCLLMTGVKGGVQEDNNEIEEESFTLQRFLKVAKNSESIAIDLLHCSDNHILTTSSIFENLRKNKSKFYTKRMVGGLGYAKNMALKYGFRADRLNAAKELHKTLENAQSKGAGKLYQIWDELPIGEHY